jgi:WD40 repeat protein
MLDRDSESCEWVSVRPARSAGWVPSALVTLGLIALGFILVRAGSERSSAGAAGPVATCRALLEGRECPVFALAWSPDGRRLAISDFGPIVKVWDRESGAVRSIEGKAGQPRFVVGWSEDGRQLIVVGLDEPVEAWDLGDSVPLEPREVIRPEDYQGVVSMIAGSSRGGPIRVRGPLDRRSTWLPNSGRVATSAAFAPDGRSIATAEVDLSVRIWDAATGHLRHTFPGENRGFSSVAFSPDGARVAAGGGGAIRVWDANSGALRSTLGEGICGSAVIGFSPDGTRIVAASWDGSIRVWDLSTGLESVKLAGHDGQVLSLAWSPDGKTLASGGYDSTVRLWDVVDPIEVARAQD